MPNNTLQIRAFPDAVKKRLKIKAAKLGISLRELVTRLLAEGAK
jgi:plasmid stability protein